MMKPIQSSDDPTSITATRTLIPAPALASSRYNRQLLLPQLRLSGQQYLLSSKVLIIGLGGLGSPAALYLAGAGVGKLGFLDGDDVEISNLHRQIVHTEDAARSGMSKVRSAAARCQELNSEIEYVCHEEQALPSNILDIVAQYDLVLDCTDNPATRYLISDACVVLGKVLVSGAAQRGEGMLIVLNSPPVALGRETKGPCYRCVFPRPPAPETVRGCSEIGILGPVVGMIGTLMAGEAIKIISSGGHLPRLSEQENKEVVVTQMEKMRHTMLLYNTYASDPRSIFRTITLRGPRKDCIACGDDEALAKKGLNRITPEAISQGRFDYQAFCGMVEDVKLLGDENRIDAAEFLQKYASATPRKGQRRKRTSIVVDVREEHEFELGPKVSGSINIPLSKILRHGGHDFDELRSAVDLDPSGSITDVDKYGASAPPSSLSVIPKGRVGVGGGMVNQETHTPTTAYDTFSRTEFPANPSSAQWDEGTTNEDMESLPVYFVCQRGNDSQIAAQKLKESIQAQEATAGHTQPNSKWGWIGDVKGGFLAIERHAAA